MKVKIPTKLDRNGYGLPDIEQWDKLFENNDWEDFYIEDDTKIDNLKTISKMYMFSEIASKVANPMYYESILVYYLEKKGIEYEIISEYDDEALKRFKDFLTLDTL